MSLIKGIVIKRREFIILLIFILFVYGCIVLLFLRNSARDEEQSRILKIYETAEDEIHNSRMNLDALIFTNDTFYLNLASDNFSHARLDFLSITDEINTGKDFKRAYLQNQYTIKQELDRIESMFENKILPDSISEYTKLNQTLSELEKSWQEYNSDFQEIAIRYHLNLKNGLFFLFALGFIVMIYFLYVISILIKSVISTDRYIIGKTIEIEQHERLRIAMDLHDGLGAYLSSIIMYIKLMQKEFVDEKCENEKLGHLSMLSNQALQCAKEVINNLNPSLMNKYGLVRALEKLYEKINCSGNTKFELDVKNLKIKLSNSIEVIVFRINNELINNTLKHSGANKAKMIIWNSKRTVFINYNDDGIGFNPSYDYSASGGKMGMQNLASRVESIGGKYKIESSPNQGVNILIQFSVS